MDTGLDTVWKPLRNPDLGLLDSLSELVYKLEVRYPELLISVRRGPSLFLCCDFSGQHSSARYETYSYLIVDQANLWLWERIRLVVREKYLPDNRRMSFKGLNDAYKQRALVPFLRAANCIPGLCLTFIVDKSLESLFISNQESTAELESECYRTWSPWLRERFSRVSSFGALLVSCMSGPMQNLIWILDEDNIFPNDTRLVQTFDLFSRPLSHCLSHTLGHVKIGTTRSEDGSRVIEDLLAIPDMVGGALCDIAGKFAAHPAVEFNYFAIEESEARTEKTKTIMRWYCDGALHTLRRLAIRIDAGDDGGIKSSCVTLRNTHCFPEFFWMKEFNKGM